MNKSKAGNDFQYSIIKATNCAFLFKVECRGCVFYEVLRNEKTTGNNSNPLQQNTENKQADWSTYNYKSALKKFKQINEGAQK